MKAIVFVCVASAALVPAQALADQCEWVSAREAARAEEILAKHPTIVRLCEPCGQTVPDVPRQATSVDVHATRTAGYHEVRVDGEAIDLAYTYVQTSPARFENLALLAGCPADGISPTLRVTAEPSGGILITTDTVPVTPVLAEPPPVASAAPAPAPEAAVPAATTSRHTIYEKVVVTRAPRWLPVALALAAGGGASLGAALTMLALMLRRRRAMRPRASELPRG